MPSAFTACFEIINQLHTRGLGSHFFGLETWDRDGNQSFEVKKSFAQLKLVTQTVSAGVLHFHLLVSASLIRKSVTVTFSFHSHADPKSTSIICHPDLQLHVFE